MKRIIAVLLEIPQITIDGGTQTRVRLNESAVAEYAETMREGGNLPPVTTFFDGSVYWLADGFHRYHAHKSIGALKIEAEIINGTRRDAVLFSVGANAIHGLRRTNEDKRKAVETLLNDEEWAKWSDREIARKCGVANSFVSSVRGSLFSENSEKSQERTYTTKHGTQAKMRTGATGKKRSAPKPESTDSEAAGGSEPSEQHSQEPDQPTEQPEAVGEKSKSATVAPAAPAEPENDSPLQSIPASSNTDALCAEIKALQGQIAELKAQRDELASNLADVLSENESMARVFDSSDQIKASMEEAKRYREQLRVTESRIAGLMNEANAAKRSAKSWQAKCVKLEKQIKDAGPGFDAAVGF